MTMEFACSSPNAFLCRFIPLCFIKTLQNTKREITHYTTTFPFSLCMQCDPLPTLECHVHSRRSQSKRMCNVVGWLLKVEVVVVCVWGGAFDRESRHGGSSSSSSREHVQHWLHSSGDILKNSKQAVWTWGRRNASGWIGLIALLIFFAEFSIFRV